ncbi:hypothetical protein QQP08_023952 [Theobroma cacao]|nr:hypothetical protein QQP08_023952 [Theobroma cacao]
MMLLFDNTQGLKNVSGQQFSIMRKKGQNRKEEENKKKKKKKREDIDLPYPPEIAGLINQIFNWGVV